MKIAQTLLVASILALITLSLQPGCTSAQSEQSSGTLCLTKKAMGDFLLSKFGEKRVAFGIGSGGNALMEIFVSETGGSWSIVGTSADRDMSCLLFSGQDFYFFGQGMLGRRTLTIVPEGTKEEVDV